MFIQYYFVEVASDVGFGAGVLFSLMEAFFSHYNMTRFVLSPMRIIILLAH